MRTWSEFNEDHIVIIAGGVTYSVLLAIFPALAAFVALYGLVGDISQVPEHLRVLSVLFPPDALKFMGEQMVRLAKAGGGGLSFALLAGVLISFWSANGAMSAVLVGLNVAYEEREKRSFVKRTAISLAFTLGLLIFLLLVVVALGAGAVAGAYLGRRVELLVDVARWPILVLAFAGSLSMLYRYGPSREMARWRWITVGSAVGTVVWLLVSMLFSFYVGRFAHYDRTYGPLGALVAAMVWIWLSAVIVLAAAELNAEIEHQTAIDSTTGLPLPLGIRGARMADSIGAAQG